MNIIFLDVDGVLNGYNEVRDFCYKWAKRLKMPKCIRDYFHPFHISEKRVKILSEIVKKTNSKVVMSSSWRSAFWKTPYEEKWGELKRLTDLLNKYNIEVIDITPKSVTGSRASEILTWLSRNEDNVEKYLILDDEVSDLNCFIDSNLVQTSSVKPDEMIMGNSAEDTGLKKKHIKIAIDLFNKQRIA